MKNIALLDSVASEEALCHDFAKYILSLFISLCLDCQRPLSP